MAAAPPRSRMPGRRIQIFGDSFVSHLKNFIQHSPLHQFNLRYPQHLVQYSGFPGSTVNKLYRHLEVVVDFEPEVVVLIVGSNDVDRNTPEFVSSAIRGMVDTLVNELRVQSVIVMQIFHKTTPTRRIRYPVDVPTFNAKVDATNCLLASSLQLGSITRFWRCRGFSDDEAKAKRICGDGTHLTPYGENKLYANIRAAVAATIKPTNAR